MVEASTVICIDVMNFAQRLVALRKQRGLTQQALADRVGIYVSNIRRWEGGQLPAHPSTSCATSPSRWPPAQTRSSSTRTSGAHHPRVR